MMMMMRCIFWGVSGKGGGRGCPDPAFSFSFFTTNVCHIYPIPFSSPIPHPMLRFRIDSEFWRIPPAKYWSIPIV